jgi:hypothetical protein
MWTSAFRLFIRADVPALGYFPVTARLGPLMQPEDNYRAARFAAADAIAAGITTVHNWAHNTRSPEHADAELSAMRDTGLRGRFAYGTPVGLSDDAPMDLAGLARVKRDWMPDKDGLLTLGICSRNLGAVTIGGGAAAASRGILTIENIKRDWDGARALGLPITMHTSGASPIMALEQAGLLGPDVQFIHPLLTTPRTRDHEGARRQLLDRAAARIAAVLAARRHSARRAPGGGRSRSASRPTISPRSAATRSRRCASCSRCTRTASARACRSR